MILSQKITNLCEHGVIVRGRAQFLTYLNPTTEKIGILNIYGHSYTGPRANLWQKIANYPLPDSGFLTPCSHKFLPEVLIIHLTRTTITRGYGWDLANPQLNIRPLSHIYKNQTKRSHTAQTTPLRQESATHRSRESETHPGMENRHPKQPRQKLDVQNCCSTHSGSKK